MNMVKIGKKHQVTIPRGIFNKLGLKEGDYLLADSQDGRITLSPAEIAKRNDKESSDSDPFDPVIVSSHVGEDRTQGFLRTMPKEE